VIGAGVIYWGVSSGSRVSESAPSEDNPNRLKSAPFIPHLPPQFVQPLFSVEERPRQDFGLVPDDSRPASLVELPLFVFRW